MILAPLTLSDRTPLLNSKTRHIYVHPDNEQLLVKVHIDRKPAPGVVGLGAWWAYQKDRFLYTTGVMRELQQFVASRYRYDPIVRCIAPVYGVVDTDVGMGLLVAAVRDAEGRLAPTVRRLFREQAMTPERCHQLDTVLTLILTTPLVIGDLNEENIVLQNADGQNEAFMLIDGLGERTLLPAQRWIGWLKHRQKKRFVAKVRRKIDRVLCGEV
ncbi:MAG: YrbL family protein [Natronospirillum sp.]